MGIGAVCHTVNPRLSDKDIKFIINDGGAQVLISDITFAAQVRDLDLDLDPDMIRIAIDDAHLSLTSCSSVVVQLERVVPDCPALEAVVFLTDG